jgi:hypothetical protein
VNGKEIAPCLELIGAPGRLAEIRIATACEQHQNLNLASRGFQDLSENQRDSANRRAASTNQNCDPRKRGSFASNPLKHGAIPARIVDSD